MKLLLVCVFGCIHFVPATALAARSIPMCSVFAECAEAPPPGTTPTGGEVRAKQQWHFEHGPSFHRGANNDSRPVHWQLVNPEPLVLTRLEVSLTRCKRADPARHRPAASDDTASRGVRREIYRPPCHAA